MLSVTICGFFFAGTRAASKIVLDGSGTPEGRCPMYHRAISGKVIQNQREQRGNLG